MVSKYKDGQDGGPFGKGAGPGINRGRPLPKELQELIEDESKDTPEKPPFSDSEKHSIFGLLRSRKNDADEKNAKVETAKGEKKRVYRALKAISEDQSQGNENDAKEKAEALKEERDAAGKQCPPADEMLEKLKDAVKKEIKAMAKGMCKNKGETEQKQQQDQERQDECGQDNQEKQNEQKKNEQNKQNEQNEKNEQDQNKQDKQKEKDKQDKDKKNEQGKNKNKGKSSWKNKFNTLLAGLFALSAGLTNYIDRMCQGIDKAATQTNMLLISIGAVLTAIGAWQLRNTKKEAKAEGEAVKEDETKLKEETKIEEETKLEEPGSNDMQGQQTLPKV